MLKKLVKHGNTFALPIDKKMLSEANLSIEAKFDIQVLPGGGLYIQSIEEIDRRKIQEEFESITEKYDEMFKRLADQ